MEPTQQREDEQSLEEMHTAYEELDQEEYAAFMAELDERDAARATAAADPGGTRHRWRARARRRDPRRRRRVPFRTVRRHGPRRRRMHHGGRHRSAAMVQHLAERTPDVVRVVVAHRDIHRPVVHR